MENKFYSKFLTFFIYFCISFVASAQINIDQLQKDYGEGKITFKKKIKISFVYDAEARTYSSKVTFQFDQLYISSPESNGLVQIPFNAFQQLKLKKARYFKLDSIGNKVLIENVKVKHADEKDYFISGIFYADLKVKQFKSQLDLPDNYFLSYSYDIIYKDLKFLHSFYLQNEEEVVKDVEISIKKDVNIDLNIFEQNLGPNIKRTEDDSYIKYTANSMNRIESRSSSVSGNYYLPHLILSVASFETPEKVTEVLKSIQNQYDWYRSLILELKPNHTYLKQLSNSIVEGKVSDEDKIDALYNWVQNNIQYVAFEDGIAGFKPSEANEVAKLKYGDCKGMANLLVNLLKEQGFDADHAWIGTRNNNYNYSIPSLIVDNHMICALNYQQKRYFLDGTSKSAKWKNPPSGLEGKEVLIANGNSYFIDTIKVSTPKENIIRFKGEIDLSSPQPEVTLNVELSGHFVRDYLSYFNYVEIGIQNSIPYYFIEKYLDGIIVDNISKPSISTDKITYTLKGKYLNLAKGTTQLTLFPFLPLLDYPTLKEDDAPFYIDYPHTIAVQMAVKNSPKNGQISLHEPSQIKFNQSFARYKIEKKPNNEYLVNQELSIAQQYSPLKDYSSWNRFIHQIKALSTHPITYQVD